MGRKRILFVAEAVTLAHIARPLALASALSPADYDITLACDTRCDWLTSSCPFRVVPIRSISPDSFSRALAKGSPLYPESTLRDYVRDDLELISRARPDLIVGDFRLSLSVSARLAKTPYATIANAYWSPYGRPRYVAPSLPMTRVLPIGLCNTIFRVIRPAAFALHAMPLNRVRREYGLGSLGSDLRKTYTDADHVLYADVPELFPLQGLPANHRFIGPILWSPPGPMPRWWNAIPDDLPLIYVSLGSSGDARLLPALLAELGKLPVRIMVATAGNGLQGTPPANAHVADFLPGDVAAQRATLTICNGGSLTCQQSFAAGTPVIGLPGNLDQFLNMHAVVAAGAGCAIRADRFEPLTFGRTVSSVLSDPSYAKRARAAQAWQARHPGSLGFATWTNAQLA